MKEKDNICYIASAGAGKTTWLIESLLARRNVISNHKKIAIVTFTIKNQEVISAYSGGYPFSISGDIRSVPS